MSTVGPDAATAWCASAVVSDSDVVDRVRAGDPEAFETLVRRYEPGLHRYLARLTGSAADAEDLAQSAFVRAWRKLPSFRGGARFGPWIFAIARRLAIDLLRRRRAHAPVEAAEAAAGPDPGAVASGDVWAVARRSLSERAFTALWLMYAEDCSVREIAERMRASTPAVKVTLHRARRTLARAWRDEDRRARGEPPAAGRGEEKMP